MQTSPAVQPDHETEFVACLLEAAHKTGVCFNEAAFVNFYVALKSKPMVILTGPEGSGKIAAVHSNSRNLQIALDLAIAQIFLPQAVDTMRENVTLRERLAAIVTGHFPRSADTVAAMAAQG